MDWGDLRRLQPFSDLYGYDRGTPVDRYYIDHFLEAYEQEIRGDILEVGDATYTFIHGKEVTPHILDVDLHNPKATLYADLGLQGSLPAECFDAFLLLQTLQYVSDPRTAIANAHRCLRPGGVLLVSVPCLSRIDAELQEQDRWRFTPTGLRSLLGEFFDEVSVQGYGSVLTGVAFLVGLAAEELRTQELEATDRFHPLLACGYALK